MSVTDEWRVDVRDRDGVGGNGAVWNDPWRVVRVLGIGLYVVAFAAWFRSQGVIIDRISVMAAVVVLLVVAHLGRPWYRWRQLATDVVLYAAMWFAYEETRGAADRLGMPLQVESVRNIDRVLFLGADPTVWLQSRFYRSDVVRWYDVVASISYYSHFVVPVVVIVTLWIGDRIEWIRFIRRFATVLAIGCVGFVLLPTAPPWMAGGGDRSIRLDALPSLARPAGRGWRHLGLDSFVHVWEHGRDWVNRVAAMPSLHAAFSLIVVVYFFPRLHRRWVRAVLLVHPMVMAISLVYLAEHYVIDVVAGWAAVVVSFVVWDRVEAAVRGRRATAARAALDIDDVAVVSSDACEPSRGGCRSVLLDGGVVVAATDPTHPATASARRSVLELLGGYETGAVRLWMRPQDRDTIGSCAGSETADAVTAACRLTGDERHLIRRARRHRRRTGATSLDDDALVRAVMELHRIDEFVTVDEAEDAVNVPETT